MQRKQDEELVDPTHDANEIVVSFQIPRHRFRAPGNRVVPVEHPQVATCNRLPWPILAHLGNLLRYKQERQVLPIRRIDTLLDLVEQVVQQGRVDSSIELDFNRSVHLTRHLGVLAKVIPVDDKHLPRNGLRYGLSQQSNIPGVFNTVFLKSVGGSGVVKPTKCPSKDVDIRGGNTLSHPNRACQKTKPLATSPWQAGCDT